MKARFSALGEWPEQAAQALVSAFREDRLGGLLPALARLRPVAQRRLGALVARIVSEDEERTRLLFALEEWGRRSELESLVHFVEALRARARPEPPPE